MEDQDTLRYNDRNAFHILSPKVSFDFHSMTVIYMSSEEISVFQFNSLLTILLSLFVPNIKCLLFQSKSMAFRFLIIWSMTFWTYLGQYFQKHTLCDTISESSILKRDPMVKVLRERPKPKSSVHTCTDIFQGRHYERGFWNNF